MSYDTLMTMGKANKCPDCGGTWYDSERGCGCGACEVCGIVMGAEYLDEYGRCFDCAVEDDFDKLKKTFIRSTNAQ